MDFAGKPGLIFVVATLLPLASFALILLAFAVRTALRSSPEGSLGAKFYQGLGGDVPSRWPAWLATAAIGLAFVLSAVGSVWFYRDHHQIETLKEETAKQERKYKEAPPKNETERERLVRMAGREVLAREIDAGEEKIEELESHWAGSADWIRLGAGNDTRQAMALSVGFKIDHLSIVMVL